MSWLTRKKLLKPISFGKSDVEVKALVNTLHHSLAKGEAEKPGDKPSDVEATASADRLGEEKAGKDGETLTDFKAASQVVTLDPTLAKKKAETVAKD